MDNRGHTPDEAANTQQQRQQPRIAKGHSEPTGIMRDADLGKNGGGSSAIHGNQRKPNGFSDPTYVSAEEMRSKQMEIGNTEYMAEMLAEQRENQTRNQLGRNKGQANLDDTSDKTA